MIRIDLIPFTHKKKNTPKANPKGTNRLEFTIFRVPFFPVHEKDYRSPTAQWAASLKKSTKQKKVGKHWKTTKEKLTQANMDKADFLCWKKNKTKHSKNVIPTLHSTQNFGRLEIVRDFFSFGLARSVSWTAIPPSTEAYLLEECGQKIGMRNLSDAGSSPPVNMNQF